MLQVTQRRVHDLARAEREAWAAFQAADPMLASPYFSLEYLDAVASVRRDVRVLVARRSGAIAGFLPLHLGALGHARPLGGPLGDHHGLIAASGERIDLRDMLRRGGVAVYDFYGVPGNQAAFRGLGRVVDGSWVIDLSEGYDHFVQTRSALEPKAFRNLRARQRKLREADAVFRLDDPRADVFETALAWKSEQYRRTGHFDVFSVDWTRKMLQSLLKSNGSTRGLVSSLEIGGQLAAVHVGMRSACVMHYWFPVYDPQYSQFGPGLALLIKLCEGLSEDGVTEVHLGPGEYEFKAQLGSWQFPLRQGFAGTPSVALAARGLAAHVERAGAALPLGPAADLPGRVFRRIDRMAAFRPA